jgi:hypothetical protein
MYINEKTILSQYTAQQHRPSSGAHREGGMAADTKILESRLLTRESAIGGSSLSRCALKFQQYMGSYENLSSQNVNILANSPPADGTGSRSSSSLGEYEALCREVMLYQLEMKKYDEIYQMYDEETHGKCSLSSPSFFSSSSLLLFIDYEVLEKEIQQKILGTQESIDHLTTELIQQKSLRRHRDECENLAKIVNSVPSCDISKRKIAHLEEEIGKVNEQIAAQEAREKLRFRQFKLISQAIADMSRSLDEEAEAQNELLLLQQQLQSSADGAGDGDDGEDADNDDNDGEEGGGSRDKRTEKTDHMEQKAKKPRIEEVEEEEGEEGQGGGGDEEGKEKEGNGAESSPSAPSPSVVSETGRSSPRPALPSDSSPRTIASASSTSGTPRGQSAALRQQALASKKVHEPEEGEEEEHKGGEEGVGGSKVNDSQEDGMEVVK